jgi:hypothetical protein
MNIEKLDSVADKVEQEFAARIQDLNNGEVEYLLDQLVQRFEGHLNRVQAATQGEQP